MSIRVVTLGGLKVYAGDDELTALPGQPVRAALLVHLAVEGGATRDRLLELFWPEKDQEKARSALSSTLHELGKSLPGEWRDASCDVVRTTGAISVDANEFADAVEAAAHERAIDLYSGEFLEGLHLLATRGFEGWVDRTRSHLARLHRKARSEFVSARIEAGDLERALAASLEWAELEPLEDEAHHHCIELLARTGRPAEAVRVYQRFRERLADELDLEPMESTVSLVERVRSGELAGPSRGVASPGNEYVTAAPVQEEDTPDVTPGSGMPSSAEEPSADSVAVLPFVNMSPDPENEYFSDGMTEELITALSRLDGLRVAAATSSFALKDTSRDIREISDLLGVDWLIEGSVRKSGDDLRISARLVSADDGYELWSETYDRKLEDVFRIQDEIAWAITDSLGTHLGERRGGAKRQTGNPEAYDSYLLGRYFYATRTPEGLERAIRYFQKALEHDPEYALAHSGLADAYIGQAHFQYRPPLEVMPDARAATEKALEIDPTLAEAQSSRAHIEDTFNWQWTEAEKGYRRAIELDPSYALARISYADLLTALGRHDESRAQARQAEELEPLSVPIKFQKGTQLYRARRFDEALRVLERALEMDPAYFPARAFHALTLTAMGRGEEAASLIGDAMEENGVHPGLVVARGYALARIGREAEARKVLEMLRQAARHRYVPSLLHALIHGALGDLDPAFDALERALEERYAQATFLAVDPLYDPLADDPRFTEILEKLELPPRE